MFKSVIITRDSHAGRSQIGRRSRVQVWSRSGGVTKRERCTIYSSGTGSWFGPFEWVSEELCLEIYGGFPRAGQAWLVEEKKDNILWTRYDHLYKYNEPMFI